MMNDFQKAIKLYSDGVDHEKSGRFDDAIRCYKTAFFIEPEIDHKLNRMEKLGQNVKLKNEGTDDSLTNVRSDDGNDSESLMDIFQRNVNARGRICQPSKPTQAGHISNLPPEMLSQIFNWVVSENLDFRSLENCSQVCQGFYLCARNMMLWKAACEKIWGDIKDLSPYSDYRDMYINRVRIETEGCYISEIKYYREGECSFQDKSSAISKPFHLVKYYRYLRFFADGIVLLLNTTDAPINSLPKLRINDPKAPDVRIGTYRVCGDQLHLKIVNINRYTAISDMIFEIKKCRGKCIKLVWRSSLIYSREPSINVFSVPVCTSDDKFAPFIYSRVKSFLLPSEKPLM